MAFCENCVCFRLSQMYYVSETDMLLATKDALFSEVLAFRQVITGEHLVALKQFYSLLKDVSNFPKYTQKNTLLDLGIL